MILRVWAVLEASDATRGQAVRPLQEIGEAKSLLEQLESILKIFEVTTIQVMVDLTMLSISTSLTTMLVPMNEYNVSAR